MSILEYTATTEEVLDFEKFSEKILALNTQNWGIAKIKLPSYSFDYSSVASTVIPECEDNYIRHQTFQRIRGYTDIFNFKTWHAKSGGGMTIEEFGQHLDRNSAKVSFDLTSSSIETLEFILI